MGRPKTYVDITRAEYRVLRCLCVQCGRFKEDDRLKQHRCQRCQDRDTERKRLNRAAIKAEAELGRSRA